MARVRNVVPKRQLYSGYILFNGLPPGATSGSLLGRSIIQGPSLAASGQAASGLRLPLTVTPVLTLLATYYATQDTVEAGQFRIAAYVAAVAADTPNIYVSWEDPDATGLQTLTLISGALGANSIAQAMVTIVAQFNGGQPIQVIGTAATNANAFKASATIDQVG